MGALIFSGVKSPCFSTLFSFTTHTWALGAGHIRSLLSSQPFVQLQPPRVTGPWPTSNNSCLVVAQALFG